MAIPLHLGVHLLGLAVAAGLVLLAVAPSRGGRPVLASAARAGVAVGGLLLVVSHLLVGSLVAAPEGWSLVVRAAGYAAFAVGAAGGVTGGVAVVALLPPVAPLAAGLAGLAAAVAAARGVLGRGRQVLPLVLGIVLWAVADLTSGQSPTASGAVSIAGSLTAGTWVAQRAARRSLAGRTSAANLAVLLALVVGLASASGSVLAADVRAEQIDRLDAVASAQAGDLVDRAGASLEATASALAGATIVTPLEAGEDEVAAAAAARITALPDIDLVVLTDAGGDVVGATAREGQLGPAAALAIAGSGAVGQALGGDVARGVVDLGNGDLAVVGSVPVVPTDEAGSPLALRQVGALVVGRLLTAPAVIERVGADTAGDAAVVVGNEVVASTFAAGLAPEVVANAGTRGVALLGGAERIVASAPLGDPVAGQLLLALSPSAVTDAGDTALRTTFLLAVVGLLVAGAVATVLARRIVEPVTELTVAAERVATGDLATRVSVDRDDEVGRLAEAFDGMTTALEVRDRDLRDSLASQRALRDRLETVTGSMGEALVATDADGRLTTVNRAAGTLFGDDPAVLVGRPLDEVLVGRAEGGVPLAAALVDVEGDVQVRGELDGSRRILEATATRLEGPDAGPAGRVLVLRDITEQVLADRVRTEVIANLSHELNTPLTPIKAFLEVVAAREGVEAPFRPMLDLAREGRARLERTITALVDLAELEAGKKQVVLDAVPADRLVADAVARWRSKLEGRKVTRRVARGTPPVRTDAGTVGRILDELVDNAAKFGDGAVRIGAAPAGDDLVRITVRDDGPGIAAERATEVLELFTQADGSSTRAVGGLGIGLPIAVRLADLVGARLELAPGPRDVGLEVSLLLPVDEGGVG
ncbi:HAMP domain-containing protein [Nitriliruptoraceae bacterium ZYF776]|nr:HAMP domain-containing protein [Profundirhabdus halotolerans]